MKIIFINRFFHPDHSATSQMLSDLTFALAARGHTVQVITSRLAYNGGASFQAQETIDGVEVRRIRTTAFGRGRLAGRSLDYLSFFLATGFLLMRQAKRGDIVIVKTDPPLLSVLAAPIAWLKGARCINWLQDLFPEVAAALSTRQGKAQKWGFSLLQWLRDLTLRHAAANAVIGERMAKLVEARGVAEERISIIPNWADGRRIRPIDRAGNVLRKEWGLNDDFVVGYSGNLGRAHSFNAFLAAMGELEARSGAESKALSLVEAGDCDCRSGSDSKGFPGQGVRWLFVGGGANMGALKRAVREKGYGSAMFQPYQPGERLAESLSAADVHLISLKPELEGLIVPSKYYGIAAAGRPAIFIGDPAGELARIIKDSHSGFVVREGDGAGLADAIQTLANDPALAAEQGARARRRFESDYDLRHAIVAWDNLIEKVCSCSPAR